MKKILFSTALLLSIAAFAQTSTYPGNGKTGFGGPIGTGSVSITDNGSSLTFTLTKGTGDLNDIVVFYVDVTSGGISNTTGLTNIANKYEKAVSGKRGENNDASNLTFPAGFQPDGAIAFDRDGGKTYVFAFGGMVEGNPPVVTPTGTATSPTYSQTVNKSDLGLGTGPVTFKFLATYISGTAYRSDEAIGDPFTGFTQGWNSYTVTSFNTYSSTTMPVKIADFKAVKEKENVLIKWVVANETNIDEYRVQRSTNGIQFSTISTLKARNIPAASNYSFSDNSAAKGVNYYRLAIIERGKTDFTKVVIIKNIIDKNSFTVFTQGQILNLKFSGIEAGTYRLSVMNTSGQLLQSLSLLHDGSDGLKQIDMKGSITRGVYRVTLQGENAQYIKSILVQ